MIRKTTLITPPRSKFTGNTLEVSKFNMTWYISMMLLPTFTLLGMLHIVYHDPNILTSSLGLVLSTGSLVVLKATKDYKAMAMLSVIIGTILCQVSIFYVADSNIISDLMWIILISFYGFYLLGPKFGVAAMILNMIGLLLFLGTPGLNQPTITDASINLKTGVNVGIVTIVIAFIIYKIIQSSENTNIELQRLNSQLQLQNEEKTVLLKEIHHRVKNNLQLITSLLRLQAADVDDKKVEEHFNEAVSRIKSMSLIHEKMYQQDELARLDLQLYLETLMNDILGSQMAGKQISTSINSDLIEVNIKNIVPLALLFNELITNSLKHAFKEQSEGEIKLSVKKFGQHLVIEFTDNGQWIAPSKSNSFGIELIETLCDQLEGTCARDTSSGTSYHIECNIEE